MELFNMGSVTKKASKVVAKAQKILFKPKGKINGKKKSSKK